MRGFVPFAICFGRLVAIWREHYVFFRRYGLQDDATVLAERRAAVRRALLRLSPQVPLHARRLGGADFPAAGRTAAGGAAIEPPRCRPVRDLRLRHRRDLRRCSRCLYAPRAAARGSLELTPLETFDTRASIVSHLLAAASGSSRSRSR
jgi:hypothetical protein